jgi:phenylpyruvate tautomerase PptA (4-oxalocrotonate tautomerase family)
MEELPEIMKEMLREDPSSITVILQVLGEMYAGTDGMEPQ